MLFRARMRNNEFESDLEDGEIREDDYEDISDCSLSEIVTVQKNDTSSTFIKCS